MVPWAWGQLSEENEPTFHRRESGHSCVLRLLLLLLLLLFLLLLLMFATTR
jgi:hypothetical protein